jgi:hypothetical protein
MQYKVSKVLEEPAREKATAAENTGAVTSFLDSENMWLQYYSSCPAAVHLLHLA